MKKKAFFNLLVCIALLMTIVGCNGTTSPTTAPVASATSAATATPAAATATPEPTATPAAANEFGWVVPDKPIVVNYYAGTTDPSLFKDKHDLMYNFLKDKFNVTLNKITTDVDMTEQLNLWIVSGEYPDVIANMDPNKAEEWIKQGKAQQLDGLIDQYGPNIKSQLGDLYKRYFNDDGKLYVVPYCWGLLPIPDWSVTLRYDWWQEIGSPQFQTPEQFYDVIKQILAKHPTNAAGQKVYALSDLGGTSSACSGTWKVLTGAYGIKDQYAEAADHTLTHWMNTDVGLKIVKFVNQIYRDGNLDPDFSVNKFADWEAKYSQERVVATIGSWWHVWTAGHETWQKTDPNWTWAKRGMNFNIKADGVENSTLSPKDTSGYYRCIITDKCKNPADVIKWWNFEITDLGTKLICWGIPDAYPNGLWQLKDGVSVWNDEVVDAWSKGTFNTDEYQLGGAGQFWMVAGQQKLSNGDPRTEPWCNVWIDQNFNTIDPAKKILNENLKGTMFDNSYRLVTFNPDDPITVTNQQITDLLNTGWMKMITASSEADCEKAFYALRDQLNAAGLHDLEKFRTQEYLKKLAAWN